MDRLLLWRFQWLQLFFSSSRSVASSSHSVKWHRSRRSPGPRPAPASLAIPDPSTLSFQNCSRPRSQTRYPSRGHLHTRDPLAGCSQSLSRTRHPFGGHLLTWDPSASRSQSRSRTRHLSVGCTSTQDPFSSRPWSRTQARHLSWGCPLQWDLSAIQFQSRRPSGGHTSTRTSPPPTPGCGHRLLAPDRGIRLLWCVLHWRVCLVVRGCIWRLGRLRTCSGPHPVPRILVLCRSWGFSFGLNNILIQLNLLKLYTDFICPCLEYCSHVWGSSPYTSLLDGVESKAIRLIGDPSLTSALDPLSLRRKVASLSLFYRYYFGHCCDELATCIPRPMAQPRSTWQASFAHNYCVELSNARINRFSEMIVMVSSLLLPAFGTLSLLLYFRLPSTFRPSKGRSSTTLGTRWHDFFFFFYPFRYFINLFYFHCLSFPFLKGCRLEKGHV